MHLDLLSDHLQVRCMSFQMSLACAVGLERVSKKLRELCAQLLAWSGFVVDLRGYRIRASDVLVLRPALKGCGQILVDVH